MRPTILTTNGDVGAASAQVAPSGELPAKLIIDSWHAGPTARQRMEQGWSQAVWRTRGGHTLRVNSFADECNRPVAFALVLGNVSDVITAVLLISAVAPTGCLIAEALDVDSWGRPLLSRSSSRSCVDLNESCS